MSFGSRNSSVRKHGPAVDEKEWDILRPSFLRRGARKMHESIEKPQTEEVQSNIGATDYGDARVNSQMRARQRRVMDAQRSAPLSSPATAILASPFASIAHPSPSTSHGLYPGAPVYVGTGTVSILAAPPPPHSSRGSITDTQPSVHPSPLLTKASSAAAATATSMRSMTASPVAFPLSRPRALAAAPPSTALTTASSSGAALATSATAPPVPSLSMQLATEEVRMARRHAMSALSYRSAAKHAENDTSTQKNDDGKMEDGEYSGRSPGKVTTPENKVEVPESIQIGNVSVAVVVIPDAEQRQRTNHQGKVAPALRPHSVTQRQSGTNHSSKASAASFPTMSTAGVGRGAVPASVSLSGLTAHGGALSFAVHVDEAGVITGGSMEKRAVGRAPTLSRERDQDSGTHGDQERDSHFPEFATPDFPGESNLEGKKGAGGEVSSYDTTIPLVPVQKPNKPSGKQPGKNAPESRYSESFQTPERKPSNNSNLPGLPSELKGLKNLREAKVYRDAAKSLAAGGVLDPEKHRNSPKPKSGRENRSRPGTAFRERPSSAKPGNVADSSPFESGVKYTHLLPHDYSLSSSSSSSHAAAHADLGITHSLQGPIVWLSEHTATAHAQGESMVVFRTTHAHELPQDPITRKFQETFGQEKRKFGKTPKSGSSHGSENESCQRDLLSQFRLSGRPLSARYASPAASPSPRSSQSPVRKSPSPIRNNASPVRNNLFSIQTPPEVSPSAYYTHVNDADEGSTNQQHAQALVGEGNLPENIDSGLGISVVGAKLEKYGNMFSENPLQVGISYSHALADAEIRQKRENEIYPIGKCRTYGTRDEEHTENMNNELYGSSQAFQKDPLEFSRQVPGMGAEELATPRGHCNNDASKDREPIIVFTTPEKVARNRIFSGKESVKWGDALDVRVTEGENVEYRHTSPVSGLHGATQVGRNPESIRPGMSNPENAVYPESVHSSSGFRPQSLSQTHTAASILTNVQRPMSAREKEFPKQLSRAQYLESLHEGSRRGGVFEGLPVPMCMNEVDMRQIEGGQEEDDEAKARADGEEPVGETGVGSVSGRCVEEKAHAQSVCVAAGVVAERSQEEDQAGSADRLRREQGEVERAVTAHPFIAVSSPALLPDSVQASTPVPTLHSSHTIHGDRALYGDPTLRSGHALVVEAPLRNVRGDAVFFVEDAIQQVESVGTTSQVFVSHAVTPNTDETGSVRSTNLNAGAGAAGAGMGLGMSVQVQGMSKRDRAEALLSRLRREEEAARVREEAEEVLRVRERVAQEEEEKAEATGGASLRGLVQQTMLHAQLPTTRVTPVSAAQANLTITLNTAGASGDACSDGGGSSAASARESGNVSMEHCTGSASGVAGSGPVRTPTLLNVPAGARSSNHDGYTSDGNTSPDSGHIRGGGGGSIDGGSDVCGSDSSRFLRILTSPPASPVEPTHTHTHTTPASTSVSSAFSSVLSSLTPTCLSSPAPLHSLLTNPSLQSQHLSPTSPDGLNWVLPSPRSPSMAADQWRSTPRGNILTSRIFDFPDVPRTTGFFKPGNSRVSEESGKAGISGEADANGGSGELRIVLGDPDVHAPQNEGEAETGQREDGAMAHTVPKTVCAAVEGLVAVVDGTSVMEAATAMEEGAVVRSSVRDARRRHAGRLGGAVLLMGEEEDAVEREAADEDAGGEQEVDELEEEEDDYDEEKDEDMENVLCGGGMGDYDDDDNLSPRGDNLDNGEDKIITTKPRLHDILRITRRTSATNVGPARRFHGANAGGLGVDGDSGVSVGTVGTGMRDSVEMVEKEQEQEEEVRVCGGFVYSPRHMRTRQRPHTAQPQSRRAGGGAGIGMNPAVSMVDVGNKPGSDATISAAEATPPEDATIGEGGSHPAISRHVPRHSRPRTAVADAARTHGRYVAIEAQRTHAQRESGLGRGWRQKFPSTQNQKKPVHKKDNVEEERITPKGCPPAIDTPTATTGAVSSTMLIGPTDTAFVTAATSAVSASSTEHPSTSPGRPASSTDAVSSATDIDANDSLPLRAPASPSFPQSQVQLSLAPPSSPRPAGESLAPSSPLSSTSSPSQALLPSQLPYATPAAPVITRLRPPRYPTHAHARGDAHGRDGVRGPAARTVEGWSGALGIHAASRVGMSDDVLVGQHGVRVRPESAPTYTAHAARTPAATASATHIATQQHVWPVVGAVADSRAQETTTQRPATATQRTLGAQRPCTATQRSDSATTATSPYTAATTATDIPPQRHCDANKRPTDAIQRVPSPSSQRRPRPHTAAPLLHRGRRVTSRAKERSGSDGLASTCASMHGSALSSVDSSVSAALDAGVYGSDPARANVTRDTALMLASEGPLQVPTARRYHPENGEFSENPEKLEEIVISSPKSPVECAGPDHILLSRQRRDTTITRLLTDKRTHTGTRPHTHTSNTAVTATTTEPVTGQTSRAVPASRCPLAASSPGTTTTTPHITTIATITTTTNTATPVDCVDAASEVHERGFVSEGKIAQDFPDSGIPVPVCAAQRASLWSHLITNHLPSPSLVSSLLSHTLTRRRARPRAHGKGRGRVMPTPPSKASFTSSAASPSACSSSSSSSPTSASPFASTTTAQQLFWAAVLALDARLQATHTPHPTSPPCSAATLSVVANIAQSPHAVVPEITGTQLPCATRAATTATAPNIIAAGEGAATTASARVPAGAEIAAGKLASTGMRPASALALSHHRQLLQPQPHQHLKHQQQQQGPRQTRVVRPASAFARPSSVLSHVDALRNLVNVDRGNSSVISAGNGGYGNSGDNAPPHPVTPIAASDSHRSCVDRREHVQPPVQTQARPKPPSMPLLLCSAQLAQRTATALAAGLLRHWWRSQPAVAVSRALGSDSADGNGSGNGSGSGGGGVMEITEVPFVHAADTGVKMYRQPIIRKPTVKKSRNGECNISRKNKYKSARKASEGALRNKRDARIGKKGEHSPKSHYVPYFSGQFNPYAHLRQMTQRQTATISETPGRELNAEDISNPETIVISEMTIPASVLQHATSHDQQHPSVFSASCSLNPDPMAAYAAAREALPDPAHTLMDVCEQSSLPLSVYRARVATEHTVDANAAIDGDATRTDGDLADTDAEKADNTGRASGAGASAGMFTQGSTTSIASPSAVRSIVARYLTQPPRPVEPATQSLAQALRRLARAQDRGFRESVAPGQREVIPNAKNIPEWRGVSAGSDPDACEGKGNSGGNVGKSISSGAVAGVKQRLDASSYGYGRPAPQFMRLFDKGNGHEDSEAGVDQEEAMEECAVMQEEHEEEATCEEEGAGRRRSAHALAVDARVDTEAESATTAGRTAGRLLSQLLGVVEMEVKEELSVVARVRAREESRALEEKAKEQAEKSGRQPEREEVVGGGDVNRERKRVGEMKSKRGTHTGAYIGTHNNTRPSSPLHSCYPATSPHSLPHAAHHTHPNRTSRPPPPSGPDLPSLGITFDDDKVHGADTPTHIAVAPNIPTDVLADTKDTSVDTSNDSHVGAHTAGYLAARHPHPPLIHAPLPHLDVITQRADATANAPRGQFSPATEKSLLRVAAYVKKMEQYANRSNMSRIGYREATRAHDTNYDPKYRHWDTHQSGNDKLRNHEAPDTGNPENVHIYGRSTLRRVHELMSDVDDTGVHKATSTSTSSRTPRSTTIHGRARPKQLAGAVSGLDHHNSTAEHAGHGQQTRNSSTNANSSGTGASSRIHASTSTSASASTSAYTPAFADLSAFEHYYTAPPQRRKDALYAPSAARKQNDSVYTGTSRSEAKTTNAATKAACGESPRNFPSSHSQRGVPNPPSSSSRAPQIPTHTSALAHSNATPVASSLRPARVWGGEELSWQRLRARTLAGVDAELEDELRRVEMRR